MKKLAAAMFCLAGVASAVVGQGMQPSVAIHDSELTRALESMPAVAPTPMGVGTTGNQWWTTNWHYFVMPESMKEALRSDGTAFAVLGDSNITAGALLVNGQPKYPIMFSLASEAIRDDEIAQLTNYVAAGGFLFVGSSSFTRNTNGTTRGDFAFFNELGVHMSVPGVTNWAYNNVTLAKSLDHRLVSHIPTNTAYVNWAMPSAAEEISWGTYPRPNGDSSRPNLPHAIWQVQPTNGATVLCRGDTFPNNNAYLIIKQYGKGWFIYYAPMQPLIGHGGFAPSMYAYVIFKRAIEWAFEASQVPVPRLSPWPYAYDAAFMVRHDLENYADQVAGISNSAYSENINGAKGDYYFTTGTLREDMAGSYNTNAVIAGLKFALTNLGATIGPHNGGLKNPSTNGTTLTHPDYNYWHWGIDEALDTSPPGYPDGKTYGLTSLSNSFSDVESWFPGIMTNGLRVWVSPFFNATREDSYDIQAQLGVKIAGDQKLTPFPHWTLSTRTPNKRYNYLSEPTSDWFYQLTIAQRMEDVPSTTNIHAMVDFYYNLGGLINFYSHMLSTSNANVHGGGSSPLPLDYITYALNTNLHPRVWSANAIGVYQWWLQRSNVQFTASYSTNGNQTVVTVSPTGAQNTNTAIEIYLPGTNSVPCLTVFTNGVLAGSGCYRSIGQTVRVRTGTAITNVVFTYGCGFGFAENFDSVTPPGLPNGWSTSASGGQSAWFTTNSSPDSSPNTAFSAGAATAGISELVSPAIILPVGQAALVFQNSYNLQSARDGGVLEIQIGTNVFADIVTAGGSFVTGGYNSTLLGGSGNSLAGRQAWSGNSGGYITTEVNLPVSASGQLIQLKWRCATDNSTASAGWRVDTIAFTNSIPVLQTQTNRTIIELTTLSVTNAASDPEAPPQALSYQLVSAPAGAGITNGVITWTPAEAQGPSTNVFTTIVTDNGIPALSSSNSFTVVVQEINTAPILPGQTNRTINELTLLTVTNTATDADLPANTLSYTLSVTSAAGVVTNASISANGVITWTPSEAQGPSTNVFTTIVTDTNSAAVNAQDLSATNTFTVVVNEINNAPTLPAQANRTIALTTLSVTNTASDTNLPVVTLVYTLAVTNAAGVVTNAAISTNGVIAWTPASDQDQTTNVFSTIVSNFNPLAVNAQRLSATNTFTVVVNNRPVIVTNSASLILEGCAPTNNAIDAGETVTVLFSLKNTGLVSTANLVATLLETNGVASPSTNQSYGALTGGGGALGLPFTFTANASCGETITALLQLQDGALNLGTVAVPFILGQTALIYSESFDGVTAPALPAGWTTASSGFQSNWVTQTTVRDTVPNAMFSNEGTNVGINELVSPAILLPLGPSQLSFRNNYNLEAGAGTIGYDGGVLEIKIGSSTNFADIITAGGSFVSGGYNKVIDPGFSNPLTNRSAWSGNSGGFTNTTVILPASAVGQSIQLRWRCGTDNGATVSGWRIDTLSITGRVCCANSAPLLPVQTNQTIPEGALLQITNTVTSPGIPANPVNYGLLSAPAGATIDTNGVIYWTPNEAQGPSTNTFVTAATNSGVPTLYGTNSFTVFVTEVNSSPTLPATTNFTIAELTTLTVTNTATDPDLPANTLSYTLSVTSAAGAVTNASISPTGVITWSPTEAQGPSTNTFTTVVTDDGSPVLSATNTFTVVVNEINTPPILPVQTNLTINELASLAVTNTATDADLPANTLSYTLSVTSAAGAVTNASISTNGVITWTPTEAQGPSTNTFTTVVTDSNPTAVNAQNLSATNTFTVVVNELNTAPVLPAQTNLTINELASLTVTNTATDTDIPSNTLTYTLTVTNAAGLVTNANISVSGVITWTPTEAQGPSTNTFTTVVTDFNPTAVNAQSLSATNTFTVVVNELNTAPVLPAQTNLTINELASLTVTNTATDTDIPSNTLTYTLTVTNAAGLVTNANISVSGVITWTPTETQGPSTNCFTTVVTDFNPLAVNAQSLSATNTFTVVVNELNTAPVLPAQTNLTINELVSLAVTNSATDFDLPANALTYVLTVTCGATPVTNASISTNGVITWTPTEAQGPSTNTFTTIVTDDGSPVLSATNSFTVVVNEVNSAPVLPGTTNYTLAELTTLTVTNTATDADLPANTLSYTLSVTSAAGAVTNAAISTNGVITWTPTEAQGPSTNTFTTIATDNSSPAMSATNAFTVIVNEVNSAPVLPVIPDRTIYGLVSLTVTNTAADSDLPINALTYTLAEGPSNAVISAAGIITWTPVAGQLPSVNLFTTVVTDSNPWAVNAQSLSATNHFTVTVEQGLHRGPTLPSQSSRTIRGGQTLWVFNQAFDDDKPTPTLTYALLGGPTNAAVDGSGVITWTPTNSQVPSTTVFEMAVWDDFVPSLGATNSFIVYVQDAPSGLEPVIESLSLSNGVVTITWTAISNRNYRLQFKTDLNETNWNDLPPDLLAPGNIGQGADEVGSAAQRFYRVLLLP